MKLTMRYLQLYPQMELELISEMLAHSKHFSDILFANNEESGTNPDPEASFVFEEFLTDVDQLAMQMTVVSLHLLGEKTLYKVLKVLLSNECLPKSNYFYDIEKDFGKIGIKLNEVDGYHTFAEVRLVSNCIKHSGIVCNRLASHQKPVYSMPTVGETVVVDSRMLDIYFARSKTFLNEVCRLDRLSQLPDGEVPSTC